MDSGKQSTRTQRANKIFVLKRIIDIAMTAALMVLMSLQAADGTAHEYLGVIFGALVLVHTYLNRCWYFALFKGKYNFLRIYWTFINLSLMICLLINIFSGIIMSESFPALNIESLTWLARISHLSSSYLSFVLMGIHTGLHFGAISGRIKYLWPALLAIILSGYGLYIFIYQDIPGYITLRNQFAFVDYDKNFLLAIFENFSMFSFWVLIGNQSIKILSRKYLSPCVIIALTVIIYFVFRIWLGVPENGF
ncbi:MAG: DUF4405 domain-containing protein [Synergistaceae bacterium]|nr:DUF4405 domain-containing protein [Synergistaceae bacterium]